MTIISIIVKDIKNVLRDRKALAIIIIMPIVLMVILSFALKGSFNTDEDWSREKAKVCIVKNYNKDEDIKMFNYFLNRDFIKQETGKNNFDDLFDTIDINPEKMFFNDFLDSEEVSKIIEYRLEDESKAMKLLDDKKVSAVIILPDKYVYDMMINMTMPFRNKIKIKIFTNPDKIIDGGIVKSVIAVYTKKISSVLISKNVLVQTAIDHNMSNADFKKISDILKDFKKIADDKVDINDITVAGRKQVTSSDYYAGAMLTMFILFAAGYGGKMLLEEKENKTYERMTAAGVSPIIILLGKFLTIFLIALMQIIIMIVFSYFALKVEWGYEVSVILISISSAFAVAGIGSVVSVITFTAGNYKASEAFNTVIIQSMALLGGSFFPMNVLHPIFQKLSFFSINGIALKAYLKTMMGYDTYDIVKYVEILMIIGIISVIIAGAVLTRKGNKGYA